MCILTLCNANVFSLDKESQESTLILYVMPLFGL